MNLPVIPVDKTELTAVRLRSLLRYSPETGEFVWLAKRGRKSAGSIAGQKTKKGYITIRVDGRMYLAHRLAWLYCTGAWPQHQIDHINGVRDDNSYSNLRDVEPYVNSQNQRRARRGSRSGLIGANEFKPGRLWSAAILVRGVVHRLGYFKTPEAAHEAYLGAKRVLHKGCTI